MYSSRAIAAVNKISLHAGQRLRELGLFSLGMTEKGGLVEIINDV